MQNFVLIAGMAQTLFGLVLFLTALFLILLVLIQRGRGGGLSGAFGGAGGQSAFGAKAGDTFTKITIGAASFWIILCLFGVKFLATPQTSVFGDGSAVVNDDLQANPADGAAAGGDTDSGLEDPGPSGDVLGAAADQAAGALDAAGDAVEAGADAAKQVGSAIQDAAQSGAEAVGGAVEAGAEAVEKAAEAASTP